MQQQLCRRVIELVGMHRSDNAQSIGVSRELGKVIADPDTAFAMLLELALWSEQLGSAFDEGELASCQQFIRTGLHMSLGQFRFVVQRLMLGR